MESWPAWPSVPSSGKTWNRDQGKPNYILKSWINVPGAQPLKKSTVLHYFYKILMFISGLKKKAKSKINILQTIVTLIKIRSKFMEQLSKAVVKSTMSSRMTTKNNNLACQQSIEMQQKSKERFRHWWKNKTSKTAQPPHYSQQVKTISQEWTCGSILLWHGKFGTSLAYSSQPSLALSNTHQ